MTKEKYLEMCTMMRTEPKLEDIPIDFEDFPASIQELFSITDMLTDNWDGMSGSYMGKDLTLIPYLFDLYNVEDAKISLNIINLIVATNTRIYNDKVKQKTEAAKRKK